MDRELNNAQVPNGQGSRYGGRISDYTYPFPSHLNFELTAKLQELQDFSPPYIIWAVCNDQKVIGLIPRIERQ
jgi:hypothetical protein